MNSGKISNGKPRLFRKWTFKNYPRTLMLAAAFIITTFQYGCIKEDPASTGTSAAGDVEVMIMMNVPTTSAATRSMSEKQENCIDHLNVLVFRDNGNGSDETYLYTTYATDYLSDDSGTTSTVKVGFRKSESGERHRFVFVANMKDEIAALQGSWTAQMTKAQVLETIKFEAYSATASTEAGRAWDTATPRYLPMWGESTASHVVTSSMLGSALGTIKMLRAVATVDIVLNPDAQGKPLGFGSEFTLQDIKVYNVPQKGHTAPDPDNVPALKAIRPTYSSSFARNNSTVVAYRAGSSDQSDKNGVKRLIYIPEAPNTDGAGTNIDDLDQTCLVISGSYEGGPVTWYRLDFIDKLSATENKRFDILRNHRYTFFITSVEGPGYPDEETAFQSAPLNLDTDVIVWDEENMEEVQFDGQNSLRVNPPDSVVMYKEGEARYITVKTSHQDGWKIDETTMPDFISSHWTKPGTERDTLYFEATPINNSVEKNREDYITFIAGKLRKKVKIVQLNESELTITVSPNTLTFKRGAPNPKSVVVTIYPSGLDVYISAVGQMTWVAGGFPDSNFPLANPYFFQPAPLDESINNTINTEVTFVIMKDGKVASDKLTIYQLATDILFNASTPTIPYAGGTGQDAGVYFTANSDAVWRVKNVINDEGLVGSFDNTNKPAGTGVLYEFTANANPFFRERTATFNVESPVDEEFAPRSFTVTQAFRSPYLTFSSPSINLGSDASGNPGSVTVYSNTEWSYTASSNWNSVYASATPATGGSPSAAQEAQTAVSFQPRVYGKDGNTPAPQTVTATLSFTSTNHSPQSAATNTFSVSRTVPAFFDYTGLSTPTIGRAGGQMYVYANTNAEWYATPVSGTSGGATPAGNWGNKSALVNIAESYEWKDREVNITATYNGQNVPAGYVTQSGYYFNYIGINRTDVPAEGCTYTITYNGDFPTFDLELLINGNVNKTTPCSGTSASIKLEANATSITRTVEVRYKDPKSGDYKTLLTGTQQQGPYDMGTYLLEREWRQGISSDHPSTLSCPSEWRLCTYDEMKVWAPAHGNKFQTEGSKEPFNYLGTLTQKIYVTPTHYIYWYNLLGNSANYHWAHIEGWYKGLVPSPVYYRCVKDK